MRCFKAAAAALAVAAFAVTPAVAQADPAICHNGRLSDDAGQGCADGLYAPQHNSWAGICYNGILSDDVGQGCPDGLYERTYGSRGSSSSFRSNSAPVASAPAPVNSGGGSSNSMVNPNCESSGNSQVVSSNGQYWGKYQFDRSTWVASGGSPGSYGNASEGEQDQVASRVTYDAWPNC